MRRLRLAVSRAAAAVVLLLVAAGCSSSGGGGAMAPPDPPAPSPPAPDPDPLPPPVFGIQWDDRMIEWGAPELLTIDPRSIPPGGIVIWRSLDDQYLGENVEIGRGAEVSAAPLRPGTTMVEVVLMVGDQVVDRDTRSVTVTYRESWQMVVERAVLYDDRTVGDVWVSGVHALVARRAQGGISIININNGFEVGRFTVQDMFSQDVKAEGNLAFVSHEGGGFRSSVIVVDISDPANPVEVGQIPQADRPSVHNLFVDGTTLYVASQNSRSIHAYDVTDPTAPVEIGTPLEATDGTAHDVYVRNGIVYGSYLALGPGQIGELVIGQAETLAPLSRTTWDGAFTHSSWLSIDGRWLYVLDEVVNSPVRIFDVANPAAPVLVATYRPRLGTIPHNLLVRDDRFAYIAHYKHGVEVLDISDPVHPRLVGFYDTLEGEQADFLVSAPVAGGALDPAHDKGESLFQGAWGVHWTDDGRIVVSDMNQGLFVLRFTGP